MAQSYKRKRCERCGEERDLYAFEIVAFVAGAQRSRWCKACRAETSGVVSKRAKRLAALDRDEAREQLAADLEAYLASGGKIEELRGGREGVPSSRRVGVPRETGSFKVDGLG